jgi:2'-5' RNA ligase
MTEPAEARDRRPTWREVAAMPGRRLFVAVPLSDEAVARVTGLVEQVRAGTDPAGRRRGRDVRWVRLDGLHLTLRFIGPTVEARIPPVVDAVRAAAAGQPPFAIRIDGAGAFPNPDRPRALWLGVGDGAAELTRLAGALDARLVDAGWPPSDRPFQAHLTLARSDGVPAGAEMARRLADAARGLDLVSAVDRLVLFESITGGGPARYTPLESARLRGASGAQ